ncbi:hypothetical protein [Ruminococcus sp.]|uniref:hypothetical protein n=1 Tax=Ruminococcus sp. TaxID=41978 RepID=UPI0026002376|nr:hypothetical protein [Ruminococcus sp.]
MEVKINLNGFEDISNFIDEINNNIKSDVDAIRDSQVVDARSFLGIVSLATTYIKVRINSDDDSEISTFAKICRKYEV